MALKNNIKKISSSLAKKMQAPMRPGSFSEALSRVIFKAVGKGEYVDAVPVISQKSKGNKVEKIGAVGAMIQIVDKKGNVLGNCMVKRKSSWYNESGSFITGKAGFHKVNFLGEIIDVPETPKKALKRELKEEMNIKDAKIKFIGRADEIPNISVLGKYRVNIPLDRSQGMWQ